MNKCVRLAALALILVATALSASAAVWQRGTLYNLKPSSAKQLVVADQGARLSDVASADPASCFTITELSGSWRVINPFANVALRTTADGVATGEVNGSDEAQLWLIEPGSVKDCFILVPANRPDRAAKALPDGSITLIERTAAPADRAANFSITPSGRAGFDDALTYRFIPVSRPGTVLGNGDESSSRAPIKAESADENNRGQYWQVKMTDPDKRAIYGAFYSQGFDGNRKRFVFTPAQGTKERLWVMADASKPDSMYAVAADGSLVTLAMNPADRNA